MPATTELRELLSTLTEKKDDGLVRRAFGVTLRNGSLDEKNRSVRVIASSEAIDSYDEIVAQKWDLGRYEKNSPVLYGHNKSGFLGMGGSPEDTLPIGFADDVKMVDGKLEATLKFVDEKANPMAERVWQGFLQGSLRAVSVGFYPREVREEKRGKKDIVILDDNELFEISVVPMGANPEAVALSVGDARTKERSALLARAAEKTKPTGKEKKMDELEEMKARAEKAERELAEAKTALIKANEELSALKTDKSALETALTTTKTALETATKSADDLAAKAIESEVEALVGVKIDPAEKETYVALRTANPDLFKKITDGLPTKATGSVLPKVKRIDTKSKATEKALPTNLLAGMHKAAAGALKRK